MNVIEIHLRDNIWWRFPPSMIVSSPIAAIGGWAIASPCTIKLRDASDQYCYHMLSDGTVLFDTNYLLLASDEITEISEDSEEFVISIVKYLNALRVVSRQPELPRSIVAFSSPRRVEIPSNENEIDQNIVNAFVRRYIAESRITLDDLTEASNAVINDTVPIHGELANDAAESTIRCNYRSAILFAAAAIESCAGSVLDREYNNLINDPETSTMHRCIKIKVNKQETISKDPVYLALRTGFGDGGSRFLALLHECPLYLFKRSLKLEKLELYQKAHSLYRTRNSLAHTGTIDVNKNSLLEINHNGAMTALNVANNVLEWFGEKGTSIPDGEMIKCSVLGK